MSERLLVRQGLEGAGSAGSTPVALNEAIAEPRKAWWQILPAALKKNLKSLYSYNVPLSFYGNFFAGFCYIKFSRIKIDIFFSEGIFVCKCNGKVRAFFDVKKFRVILRFRNKIRITARNFLPL